jgi:hypothetical protein
VAPTVECHVKSSVSNILPLTPFKTIDLGDEENSSPLFSVFCEKTRVFFEVNLHHILCIGPSADERPRPSAAWRGAIRNKANALLPVLNAGRAHWDANAAARGQCRDGE